MNKFILHTFFCLLLGLAVTNVQAYTTFHDQKWGPTTLGTGASISWSIIDSAVSFNTDVCKDMSNPNPCTENSITPLSSFMPTGYLDEIHDAFDTWTAVADLMFTEVSDGGGAFGNDPIADIRIGGLGIDGPYGILAFAFYPPPNGGYYAGDMILDREEPWTVGGDEPGEIDIFSIVLHELGHSFGLGHSSDTDSVMYAYYNSNDPHTGLHTDDIAGIQYLYGPATVVPIPAAAWLMLSGLGLLSIFSRRRA